MKRNGKFFLECCRHFVTKRLFAGKSFFCWLLAGGLVLAGCSGQVMKYTAVNTAMGTVVRQSVYTKEDDVVKEVECIIRELEQEELSWRIPESEIARINGAAGTNEEIILSDELKEDLTILLEVSQRSGGAFDCTLGALTSLWNIDAWAAGAGMEMAAPTGTDAEGAGAAEPGTAEPGTAEPGAADLPDEEAVRQALANTGYDKIELNDGRISLPEGMRLDLGAVGKGIACDRIAAYLEEEKVYGAVISVGGSILTYGEKPDGTPWQVGIVNPGDTASLAGTLSLKGQWFVSTSGDYERYVEVDGKRFHHILNPSTGYPAESGVCSVTILCKSGLLSDALSTACFVMGAEKGMELAESYGAEALFIDEQGNITMTDGMQAVFKEAGDNKS